MASNLWYLLANFDSSESAENFNDRSAYSARLQRHEEEIITCLGGFGTILQLALTNKEINNILSEEDINRLTILRKDTQPLVSSRSLTLTPKTPKTPKHIKDSRETSCDEFWDRQATVNINCEHNLYYRLLPKHYASYIYKKILYGVTKSEIHDDKKGKQIELGLMRILLLFHLLFFCMAQFFKYVLDFSQTSNIFFYNLFMLLDAIIMFVFSLSYLFSCNIDIVWIISQSFDFWFCMYNLVVFTVSNVTTLEGTRGHGTSLFDVFFGLNVFEVIVTTLTMILVFYLDACYFSLTNRCIVIVTLNAIWVVNYITVYWYVDINDSFYIWNPFKQYNFQYTNVNWKNMYLSSLSNIVVFTMKPVFGYFINKLTRSSNNNTSIAPRKGMVRFTSQSLAIHHRRPRLQWNSVTKRAYSFSQSQLSLELGRNKSQTRGITVGTATPMSPASESPQASPGPGVSPASIESAGSGSGVALSPHRLHINFAPRSCELNVKDVTEIIGIDSNSVDKGDKIDIKYTSDTNNDNGNGSCSDNDVVKHFGGIHNILKLCLTSTNADNIIGEGSLSKLGNMLLGEDILYRSNFFDYKLILNVDASHNLYFKLIPSRKIASFIYYNIVLNRLFVYLVYGCYFGLCCVCIISLETGSLRIFWMFAEPAFYINVTVSVALILSMNLGVVFLVFV